MKPLDDGLPTARPVDPRNDDGGDGGVAEVIAVRALYATGPPSPPREGTSRPRTRSAGSQAEDAPRANGTVRRLLVILVLLIVAGRVVERWCHRDHGSYLPQWMGSGQGLPSMENMDADLTGKVVSETAESTATEAFASPSASPTSPVAASSLEAAAAPASPSALDAGSYLPQRVGSIGGIPSIESTDAEPSGKVVNETAESTATEASPSPSPLPDAAAAPSSPSASEAGAEAEALAAAAREAATALERQDTGLTEAEANALAAEAGEAVLALERKLAALENQTAEDESPRKAALLEELLSRRERAADDSVMARILQRFRGIGAARFAVGDVVEQLYNANTLKCRVLYPFRVEEVHYGRWKEQMSHGGLDEERPVRGPRSEDDKPAPVGIRYTIAKLSDGMVIEGVPESFLRPYVPYDPETRALCNVGGAAIGEERLYTCSVLEYVRRAGEGTSSSAYRVALRGGAAEEETVVPVARMQRRL